MSDQEKSGSITPGDMISNSQLAEDKLESHRFMEELSNRTSRLQPSLTASFGPILLSPMKNRGFIRAVALTIGFGTIFSIFPTSAAAVDLSGALIIGYQDRQGGAYLNPGEGHGRFDQPMGTLALSHRFSDLTSGYARATQAGAASSISEAWLAFEGLPHNGMVTVGRFQKPLGQPLLTLGLTYPALIFHTARVQGAKLDMEYGPWRGQIGAVNGNPLSGFGTTISGTPFFGRAMPVGGLQTERRWEGYGHIARDFGGTWGSLAINVTASVSKMQTADLALLAAIGRFDLGRIKTNQRTFDLSVDYTYGDYRLSAEHVLSVEGNLTLRASNITGARRLGDWEFVVGWDDLNSNAINRPPSFPATWERNRYFAGVNYDLTSNVRIMTQYEHNKENLTNTSFVDKDGIPNDMIAAQAIVTF